MLEFLLAYVFVSKAHQVHNHLKRPQRMLVPGKLRQNPVDRLQKARTRSLNFPLIWLSMYTVQLCLELSVIFH